MELSNSSNSSSSDSDDADIINFVNRLGRQRKVRIYRTRQDHFLVWDDTEFYHRFRLSKRIVNVLLNLIREEIEGPTERNEAISPEQMLLLTIRYMACGGMLIAVGDFAGIHKTTAGKCIWKTLQAIANLRQRHLFFPSSVPEIRRVQTGFYAIAKFPKVLGALDCTHVRIQSPGGPNAETYRNRKQFFSINVQAICDSSLRFLDVVARWQGSAHDSRIFRNSLIKRRFERGDFGDALLLGDSGYALTSYCMTPIQNVQSEAENLFNESQIRTRNVIERAFGVWKRRFPVLSLGIRLSVTKVQCLIVAAAILHNIAVEQNEVEPPPLDGDLQEAINFVNNVPVINAPQNQRHNFRTKYVQYFQGLL